MKGACLWTPLPPDVIARAKGMCVTVRTPEGCMRANSRAGWPPCPASSTPPRRGTPSASSFPTGHPARKKLEEYHPAPAQPDFSDGFMTLLAGQVNLAPQDIPAPAETPEPERTENGGTVIRVTDLVRKFGSFIAVNHVSFSVRKGQVFGLLGPNGAGKSTTFRMLCGCCPPAAARSRWPGRICGPPPPGRAGKWDTWPRNSPCTAC